MTLFEQLEADLLEKNTNGQLLILYGKASMAEDLGAITFVQYCKLTDIIGSKLDNLFNEIFGGY